MDDLKIRQPEDSTKINSSQEWETEYWCKKLGCSEPELQDAIDKVGVSVEDVKRYIEKN